MSLVEQPVRAMFFAARKNPDMAPGLGACVRAVGGQRFNLDTATASSIGLYRAVMGRADV